MSNTGSSNSSVLNVLNGVLSGVENSILSFVLGIVAVFMPQLATLTEEELVTVGNNFRSFLVACGNGTPWGQALADMMTADWNSMESTGQKIAIDFAEAVATVLEQAGLLPQGK